MLFSESIYFLILFTLPAALNIVYNVHIRHVPVIREDKSVELAECVLFCMAVFLVNLLVMKTDILKFGQYLVMSENERELFSKKENFDYLSFMIHYFVVNLITSALVITVWYSLGQWVFRKVKNLTNRATGRDEEAKYNDVWRNLFETEVFVDVSKSVIKIERGGQMVTAGLIRIYPSPSADRRELALYNTDSIRELFEDDKEKKVEERIFPYAIAEYYDIETDMLIKFYDMERYNAYYEEEPEETLAP